MGNKDKKKRRGAEKTALKTEKKALSKIRKDLAAKGEENVEKLIFDLQTKSIKSQTPSLESCSQPSPRSVFSLCAHPDKEELLLFGGEYFNGSKTVMFNELYFYNIKKNRWNILKGPVSPPPRCSHQAVTVSQNGGQMWMFGGEFASPSRSHFYHFNDLWVFHFSTMIWEQVKVPGVPSSRSGHRMIVSRKHIVVFGGFYESIGDYKYFNDVHIFNLETYTWHKIEPVGKLPSPRSGCQMASLVDGRILVYGGYCREKVKKDVDKGKTHSDMFYLHLDERTSKWKWSQIKSSGIPPSARSGFSFCVAPNNYAYAFGGVEDVEDDDESLIGAFNNDLYQLELDKARWLPIKLQGKILKIEKKRRRKVKEDEEMKEDESEEEIIAQEPIAVKTYEDSIFTVKVSANVPEMPSSASVLTACSSNFSSLPKARMSAGLVIKNGILYLYGGLYEDQDRQLTLSDFYCLDIHKLEEWQTIVPFSTENLEWVESEESESSEGTSNEDMDDDEEDDSEEEMDTL